MGRMQYYKAFLCHVRRTNFFSFAYVIGCRSSSVLRSFGVPFTRILLGAVNLGPCINATISFGLGTHDDLQK